VTQTLLLTVVVSILESYLSIGRMHDLVSKLGVIVHEAFDLLRPLVLDISIAPSILWESRTVIDILTELTKASKINPWSGLTRTPHLHFS